MFGNLILLVILFLIFILYFLSLIQRYRYQDYLLMVAEVTNGTIVGKRKSNWKAAIFSLSTNLAKGRYENRELICKFEDIITGEWEGEGGMEFSYPAIKMKLNSVFACNEELRKKLLPKNIKIERINASYWIVWRPLFKEKIFWFKGEYLAKQHIEETLKRLLDAAIKVDDYLVAYLKEL